MRIERCLRCSRIWSHGCGARERFQAISRICPECVAAAFPRVA